MEWLYAALTAFNTAQATCNLELQAEVNLGIMLRLHGNPYTKHICAPYIRYRSWLVARKFAESGQELGTASENISAVRKCRANSSLSGWVYFGEAITCLCAGQLKQATHYLKKVASLTKHTSPLKRYAAMYLALICTLSGKHGKGRQLYHWVYQESIVSNDLVALCLCLLGLVRSLIATNNFDEAQEVLDVLAKFPWQSLNLSDRLLWRALQVKSDQSLRFESWR